MPDMILKIILPCLGILIIVFCIGAYFFRYGTNLKDKLQEFKLFGADVKISIITVFIIIGLIFVFAGTYFNVVDTNSKLTKLLEDEKGAKSEKDKVIAELKSEIRTIKAEQKKTMSYYLELDSLLDPPDLSHLKVSYQLYESAETDEREIPLNYTPVYQSGRLDRLLVTISNLSPGTLIYTMKVLDSKTQQKWEANSFFPLLPSLKLQRSK